MTELRKELKDRGISLPAAKKSDMIAKLAEALGAESSAAAPAADLSDSIPELVVDTTPQAVVEAAGSAPAVRTATAAAPAATPTPSLSSVIPVEASSNGAAAAITTEPDKEAVAGTAKAVIKSTAGDAKDKLAARAARFGGSGASEPSPTVSIGSGEVLTALKKRTERFGEVVSSTVKSLEAKEKLNQRASRFNLSAEEQNPTTKLGLVRKVKSSPVVETAKRPITAATPEEEERLRKRRERFGLT